MHWNNAGNYEMLPKDIGPDESFIGTCPEADLKYKKPAFGITKQPEHVDEGLSWMEKVYRYGEYGTEVYWDSSETVYTPFLQMNLIDLR